eukprot:6456212-Prymnesium_polylepis.1
MSSLEEEKPPPQRLASDARQAAALTVFEQKDLGTSAACAPSNRDESRWVKIYICARGHWPT